MSLSKLVNFEGCVEKSGPLTWGQLHYWAILAGHAENRRQFSIRQSWRISSGVDLEHVCSSVRILVERHQALRTRFSFRAGEMEQHVHGRGSLSISVLDIDGEVTEEDAEEAALGLADQEFQLSEEFPSRFRVLLSGGEPVFLVAVFSHLAVDGYSCAIMQRDFTALTEGSEDPAAPGCQPLEWAERERSSTGSSINRRSLKYFDDLLRAYPNPLFPRKKEMKHVANDRFPVILGHGAGLGVQLSKLARMWRSPVSAVALALLGASLARNSATDSFPLGVTCSNRFLPGAEDYVGMLAQNTTLGVEVSGKSMRELVSDIRRSQMAAYQHASYDQNDLDALLEAAHASVDHVGFGAVGHFVNFQNRSTILPKPDSVDDTRTPFSIWRGSPVPYKIPRFGIIITSNDQDLGVRIFADPAALPASKAESIAQTFFEDLCCRSYDLGG